ncbi:MAG: DUF11 domain-containing protein [Sedimentisphaerales bacterium]|nr:DUF11 domain-containing protein [Sedimentisphaerales bacterium]
MKKSCLILIFVLLWSGVFLLPGCNSYCWDKETQRKDPLLALDSAVSRAEYQSSSTPVPRGESQKVSAPAPRRPESSSAASGECSEYALVRTYPQENVIRLDRIMPAQAQLNAQFAYTIKVTNLTNVRLADVIVKEVLSEYYKLDNTKPVSGRDGNNIFWIIESLAPKSSVALEVVGSATRTGCISHCATVSYDVPACTSVEVVEAKLALAKTAPAEVLLCESIPVQYVVTNSGSGTAKNVRVVDDLPAGMQTADGKNQITFSAGDLAQGQSRQFTAILKAGKTGKYTNKAIASTDGGLKAEATAVTVVRQPVLEISKRGREVQFIGRELSYEITVTNKGDGAAKNTVLEDALPSGVTNVKASAGAKLSGSKIVWDLGTLEPGASRTVNISCTPSGAGTLKNTATVSAYCADAKTASVSTSVRGIPAVLLEVVDLQDPVEVGGTTTYVITATNQGSIAGTNVAITCTWEDEQQYVSSSGATNGSVSGKTITFAPLAALAPQAKATWQIVLRAVNPADVRFSVSMNTGEFDRPVEETESTNLYQ